jgi:hypothetical protein
MVPHQQESLAISDVFRMLVRRFEDSRPQHISIMEIAKEHNIQHRRVYDFFNLLSSLGICSVVERGSLAWIGVRELSNKLKEVYGETEVAALSQNLVNLFCVGKSPTLGLIALRFICLYLYLGVELLSMRQVTKLFHDGRSDIKSLERRTYLVLNFLEVIRVVEHTKQTSEYRLILDRTPIVEYAMNKKREFSARRWANTLDNLLNRYDRAFFRDLYGRRFEAFTISVQNK